MDKYNVSIIGAGALGRVLARGLSNKGYPIAGLYNRTFSVAEKLAEGINAREKGIFPTAATVLGRVIFLTVSDGVIEETAERLAALDLDFSGRYVFHCSGSKTSQALVPLQKQGAGIAAFHPVQTFTASSKPDDLHGIYFDVEGDENALQVAKKLTATFNSSCIVIDRKAKPYLHAAGVVASNYLVALLRLTEMIAKIGEMDEAQARNALMPLVAKSLDNIASSEQLTDALSGPIARGDTDTLRLHMELLKKHPKILALYQQLGEITLDVAKEGGRLSKEQTTQLETLLKS